MRRSSKRQRILIWVLSLVIVASMICSFVASLAPRSSGMLLDGLVPAVAAIATIL